MSTESDYEGAARELLRAIRGARSQVAFSRRLGFRSNVAAKWEAGDRMPTAAEAFRHSARVGIDVLAVAERFHSSSAQHLRSPRPKAVAEWLRALAAGQSISDISARLGLSRFSVGRILSGDTEPRLPRLLALVDTLTGRLPDLVDAWVGIDGVPSLARRYERTVAARQALFENPRCLLVLCLLDTTPLAIPCAQQIRKVAETLGCGVRAVRRCIEVLERGSVVVRRGGRFEVDGSFTVDTKSSPEAEAQVRRYWTDVARRRVAAPEPDDLTSYNVFSISKDDFAAVQRLQREFYRAVRALVARSEPTSIAALLVVHTSCWDPAKDASG